MNIIITLFKKIFSFTFSNVSGFLGNKFFFGILISVISFCCYSYYSLYKENIKLDKEIIKIHKESSTIEQKLKDELILLRVKNNNDIELNLIKKEVNELKKIKEEKELEEKLNKIAIDNLNKEKKNLNEKLNKFSKDNKCLNEKVEQKYLDEIKRLLE